MTPLNELQMKPCSYKQLTGEMGWDDGGSFWWEDSEEREASKTPGAAVHKGQHQSSSFLRGQWGSCWAGAGPGQWWGCAAKALPVCSNGATLQSAGIRTYRTTSKEEPLCNKKALWFATPLETATNPLPTSQLSLLWEVFYIPWSPLWGLLPAELCPKSWWLAQTSPSPQCVTTNCRQTSLGTKPAKHTLLCLLPFPLLWVPTHVTPDSTPSTLPDRAKGLPNREHCSLQNIFQHKQK